MLESIINTLKQTASQPLGLGFALLLGAVSAAASACCTLPALGILIGYSGAQTSDNRVTVLKSAVFFTLGAILSLMIVVGIAGFVGQVAQTALERYWKAFAGVAAVFLGLAAMNLLPFNLSFGKVEAAKTKRGALGSALSGLVLGGIVAVSSIPCNPGIFIVIGAAILQGAVLWAVLLGMSFALGFAIPLGAVMLGVSLGRLSLAARGVDTVVRWMAGLVLTAAGFYFLLAF